MVFQAATGFVEGIGRIREAAQARAAFGLAAVFSLLGSLWFGAGLYSAGISLGVGFAAGAAMLAWKNSAWFLAVWVTPRVGLVIDWTREMWSFQWRIALSWLSGFLIFQFSTPLFFKYLGAKEAGRYGMTQQIVTGISTLSMAWATTRQARWGRWIAINDRRTLDADFRKTLRLTTGINASASAVFLCLFFALGTRFPAYATRVAPPAVICLLFISGTLNQIVFTEATYLRAHKREPFLVISIASAILMGVGSPLLARLGLLPVSLLYFLVTTFVGVLCGTRIFLAEKSRWEGSGASAT
jgi:O-antigen/teichoic acid export membrane protein